MRGKSGTERVGWPGLWVAAALLALPFSLASCTEREVPVQAEQRAEAPPAPVPVSPGDLLDAPREYVGRTVTLSGEVSDVLNPRALTIGGAEFIPPGELLIYSANGFPAVADRPDDQPVRENDIVQVTGEVRIFRQRDAGAEMPDPGALAEWEGAPVLIAERMTVVPRAHPSTVAPRVEPVVNVADVLDPGRREKLLGQRVRLVGTRVQSLAGERAFWIGPDAQTRLLVAFDGDARSREAPAGAQPALRPGQALALSGVLRRIESAAESTRAWNLAAEDREALREGELYLEAGSLQILDR